jgi:hypothetical protein
MQNHYNLLDREEEREMNRFCNSTGVGLIPVRFNISFTSHSLTCYSGHLYVAVTSHVLHQHSAQPNVQKAKRQLEQVSPAIPSQTTRSSSV